MKNPLLYGPFKIAMIIVVQVISSTHLKAQSADPFAQPKTPLLLFGKYPLKGNVDSVKNRYHVAIAANTAGWLRHEYSFCIEIPTTKWMDIVLEGGARSSINNSLERQEPGVYNHTYIKDESWRSTGFLFQSTHTHTINYSPENPYRYYGAFLPQKYRSYGIDLKLYPARNGLSKRYYIMPGVRVLQIDGVGTNIQRKVLSVIQTYYSSGGLFDFNPDRTIETTIHEKLTVTGNQRKFGVQACLGLGYSITIPHWTIGMNATLKALVTENWYGLDSVSLPVGLRLGYTM